MFLLPLVEETVAFLLGQLSVPFSPTGKPAVNCHFPPCPFLHSTDPRACEQLLQMIREWQRNDVEMVGVG